MCKICIDIFEFVAGKFTLNSTFVQLLSGLYRLKLWSYIVYTMFWSIKLLWPQKGSLMKTQTRISDNRWYYTRKIELHRKGKKSRTVRITPILICHLFVAASHLTRLDTRSKARRAILICHLAAKSLSTNNGENSPLCWDG